MLTENKIPAIVRQGKTSISTERALNNFQVLIASINTKNDLHEQQVNNALDDLEVMLANIDRG